MLIALSLTIPVSHMLCLLVGAWRRHTVDWHWQHTRLLNIASSTQCALNRQSLHLRSLVCVVGSIRKGCALRPAG